MRKEGERNNVDKIERKKEIEIKKRERERGSKVKA